MTAEEIKAALNVDDAEVALSDSGGYYWVRVRRGHNGLYMSHSVRCPLNPHPDRIAKVAGSIEQWWQEATKSVFPFEDSE